MVVPLFAEGKDVRAPSGVLYPGLGFPSQEEHGAIGVDPKGRWYLSYGDSLRELDLFHFEKGRLWETPLQPFST